MVYTNGEAKMSNYLMTRDGGKPFTTSEFKAIPRNSDGDILDLTDAYPFITVKQRLLLSEDDYSRMDDLDQEMAVMAQEFIG